MSTILIQGPPAADFSLLPDAFVDSYMPQANGEFVKVYLYLLRLTHQTQIQPSLSSLADFFSCTEKDIRRALRYWEKAGLLALSYQGKDLCGIQLQLPTSTAGALPSEEDISPDNKESSRKMPLSGAVSAAPEASTGLSGVTITSSEDLAIASGTMSRGSETMTISSETMNTGSEASTPPQLSGSRVKELQKENQEIRQLLFLAESYLGRPLSSTDMGRILYFYDVLHFSMELLEYLIEYCVSKGSTSLHYIEKVGLAWHKDGIDTVDAAKARTNTWNKHYFSILRAFGIRNRNPIPAETEYMERWLNQYGFPLEIISEACTRTIAQTGQPSFPYAEGILSKWKEEKVTALSDIEALDARHKKDKKKEASAPSQARTPAAKTSAPNRFNNFNQRNYDYKQLERDLFQKQMIDR